MIIDPVKLIASVGVSALILAGGIAFLGSKEARLTIADFTPILSSSESVSLAQNDSVQISTLESDEKAQEYSQIDPENAKIEAEVMTASIQTSNPTNNSDWSLETISDHSLEITQ